MGATQSHPDDLGADEEEEFHEVLPPTGTGASVDSAGTASTSVLSTEAGVQVGGPKLYRHAGGTGPGNKWSLVHKSVAWKFSQSGSEDDDEDEDDEEEEGKLSWKKGDGEDAQGWYLIVGRTVQARVADSLGVKFDDEKFRVDFIADGVWALLFRDSQEYRSFVVQFQDCLFENVHQLVATQANRLKVIGKDYIGWANGEDADEAMWDAEDSLEAFPASPLRETYREAASGKTPRSLTMGALKNSYAIHDTGLDVYRNLAEGLHGEGLSISYGGSGGVASNPFATPTKGMLMRGETNMMLFSPLRVDATQGGGVQQLDIDVGKVVANWRFEKDGTPINMRDIVSDSKGAQLESSQSTFMGLDDNRLCRWDMRDRHGVVQTAVEPSPVLNWNQGHQFGRGTNFTCFDTAGDGSVAVGSQDGRVRLYSSNTLRQAKTSFPGLGAPIRHISVTFDGRWVLATTDTYMMLISTVFRDKDGREKTGFTGRAGANIAAPRLLKLNPIDAYAAGPSFQMQGGCFSFVTEEGRQERNIVATVGQYSVVWNFRRVKQSDHECYRACEGLKTCYCYKIVPRQESIIESRFMHDNYQSIATPEAPLVVATPMQISSFNV